MFEAGKQVAGLATSFRDEEGFVCDFGAHFITNRLAAALGIGRCRDVHHYGETVCIGHRTYRYPFGLIRVPRYVASAAASRARPAPPAATSAAEWYRTRYGPSSPRRSRSRWSRRGPACPRPTWRRASSPPSSSAEPRTFPPQGRQPPLGPRGRQRLFAREAREPERLARLSRGEPGIPVRAPRPGLGGSVRLESPVEATSPRRAAVGVRVRGQVHEASAVISTAPVHILARLVEGTDALRHLRFRYRPMVLVNMRFDGPRAAPRRRDVDAGAASSRSSGSPRRPGRCRGSRRRARRRSPRTSAARSATSSGRWPTMQLGELCLDAPRADHPSDARRRTRAAG